MRTDRRSFLIGAVALMVTAAAPLRPTRVEPDGISLADAIRDVERMAGFEPNTIIVSDVAYKQVKGYVTQKGIPLDVVKAQRIGATHCPS